MTGCLSGKAIEWVFGRLIIGWQTWLSGWMNSWLLDDVVEFVAL